MAQAVEAAWGPQEGLVVVLDGGLLRLHEMEVAEASHPVPDVRREAAGRRLLDLAAQLVEGDLLLCLVSGGGSLLVAVPNEDLTLADKQAVNRARLASGASIHEMNVVRKHLSAIEGGRLGLAAHPAQVVTLLVSDIAGDDPATIASGPTLPEAVTAADARAILARHGIDLPLAAVRHLSASALPPSDHPAFARACTIMVARPRSSLGAAARAAREMGLAPLIRSDAIEGEAAEAGRVMAGIARSVAEHGEPAGAPAVLLSGGETTVTLRRPGSRGGRHLGRAIAPWDRSLAAIACDTGGRDGSEHNAGALWLPERRERATLAEARDYLARYDAWGFFAKVDGLVETGPTHTNVNDFHAALVEEPA
jgi:glycerate-2-kinase